jgi:glycine/D-amino acid oxidase-like deaminating enzyme
MDTLSYWRDTVPAVKEWHEPLPDRVDVAIVGGGYTGLSAALHLGRAGAAAAVLESQTIGWGASGRNGGMVLPGLKHGPAHLIRHYGTPRALEMMRMSLDSIDTVKRIIHEEQIACDWQEVGYFFAASKPTHLKRIEADVRLLREKFDYETHLLPAEQTHEELGSSALFGGQVDDCGGGLHPAKYVLGLAHAAERAGASLHDGAHVQRVRRIDAEFEVTTARGRLRAKDVIIGTNGYTRELTPWLRRRIIPLGSYIIVTEPLDAPLADRLIPRRRMIYDSKNLLYYFRILPDNRMMFGGRVSFTPASAERSGALLQAAMIRLFPELKNTRIDYSWGGYLGLAFDLMPHTGWRDGMLYAVAYAGHGVAMATYLGMKLADVLTGKIPAPPLSDIGFPSWFFYQKNPWFMPLAGMWYQFLDRIK